jgi:hypothetical protein
MSVTSSEDLDHKVGREQHVDHTQPISSATRPSFDQDLPYRTLSATTNMNEFVVELPEGEIDDVVRLTPRGTQVQYKLVTFAPNDPENPKNWSVAFKWYCTMVVGFTCFTVAFCSSVVTADIGGVVDTFGVSEEVALLTVTLFVMGFGIGKSLFHV